MENRCGNRSELDFPFLTIKPETPPAYPTLWNMTPGTVGLQPSNYGASVRCVSGAFVLPYAAASATLVTFKDPSRPITGTVDILIYAKAANNGLAPTIQRLDSGVYVAAANPSLTTSYAWYTVFSAVAVTDLSINVINDDAAPGGNMLLKRVEVRLS
jgi:hypothetical protein